MDPSVIYLTVIITPKGISQWKMVTVWFCSAALYFQKFIRNFSHGLGWSTNLLEDIVLIGYGDAEHDHKLDALDNTRSEMRRLT